ncbi:MAG: hydrogenase formation protein HypD [Acidobacteria bacterium]|nr:hydrogenase formation protein HypD [Acidobacteriota bacterium]
MNEFRDREVMNGLLKAIHKKTRSLSPPIQLMEVCGTHTMTIHRFGLKNLLEEAGIHMLSGPGCPVCITPDAYHEAALQLVTEREGVILATFGDMTRVPTGKGSLQKVVPSAGSSVRVVYSPEESLELAREFPENEVVFFGVGFETTIPSIVLTAAAAASEGLTNYSILSALWIIPPPLRAICQADDTRIQGFLYPGHVSAIIGLEPYRFIAEEHGLPGAVTGFEPVDILLSVSSICDQKLAGKPDVTNTYTRVVRPDGNPRARRLMDEHLELKDARWRGLGRIPASGLRFREHLAPFDAEKRFDLNVDREGEDLPGCRCGDVLKGKITPPECPLYGETCRPDAPYGPCMVSFEGACLAYYKYKTRI